jgi:hypothetical protein
MAAAKRRWRTIDEACREVAPGATEKTAHAALAAEGKVGRWIGEFVAKPGPGGSQNQFERISEATWVLLVEDWRVRWDHGLNLLIVDGVFHHHVRFARIEEFDDLHAPQQQLTRRGPKPQHDDWDRFWFEACRYLAEHGPPTTRTKETACRAHMIDFARKNPPNSTGQPPHEETTRKKLAPLINYLDARKG